ncbi:lipoprotein [Limnohabitans sp.]|uniref:LPS translocon maturation chaperone LptM n=1 Tax=Limnohabitans sp. TaxID=1907725 RepID=UPI00311DE16D
MFKVLKILCIPATLAAIAVLLTGCGQKGPLVLPSGAEAAHRATLPQTLNPWHSPAQPDSADTPR